MCFLEFNFVTNQISASTYLRIDGQGVGVVFSPVVIVLLEHIVVDVSHHWLHHGRSGGRED